VTDSSDLSTDQFKVKRGARFDFILLDVVLSALVVFMADVE